MKPILENPDSDEQIDESICQHQKIHYSLMFKSVVCDGCGKTWRDEWGPVELKPTFQINMQLPTEIEMLIRTMQSRLGGNGIIYS